MNKIILVVGIVCAVVTGYMVMQRLNDADARLAELSYLTFADNAGDEVLYTGDTLSEGDIGSVSIPNGFDIFGLADTLIEDTAANRNWLVGKTLNTTIPRGRVLTYDLFEPLDSERLDQMVSPGMRAISLSVSSSNTMDNSVVPGNRIDLLALLDDLEIPEAVVVLEDVKVIAVGDVLTYDEYRSDGERSYSNITVEVTPEQGLRLTAVRERAQGEFILMLRNQCDTNSPSATCG